MVKAGAGIQFLLRIQWQPKIGYQPLSQCIPRDTGKGQVFRRSSLAKFIANRSFTANIGW